MLHQRALMVTLSFGGWGQTTKDDDATEIVVKETGASRNSGDFGKKRFPHDPLKPLRKYDDSKREWFRDQTQPFMEGVRILDIRNYQTVVDGIRQIRSERAGVIAQCGFGDATRYRENKELARQALASLYREEDYLPFDDVYERLEKITFELLPLSDSKHVILDMAEEELGEVRAHYEQLMTERESSMTVATYQRLAEPLIKLLSRQKMFGELWEEWKDVIDTVARNNPTRDANLEALRQEAEAIRRKFDGVDLLKAEDARAKAQADTKALLAKMAGYLGGGDS
ncbi:MAG: hypothetical protein ACYDC1_17400 [Limisphaerales bacterium]